MRAALLASLLAASTVLAGCIQPATVDPSGEAISVALLAKPWLDNWSARSTNLSIDYDPEARHTAVEGTITIANELGADRDYVLLFMEDYEITHLEDEEFGELEYTKSGVPAPYDMLPPEALHAIAPFTLVNITLPAKVAHGDVHVLHLAYEGWIDLDGPTFGSGLDVPVGVPNELAQNLHFGIIPLLAETPRTEHRFTLTTPDSWVVHPSAMPVSSWSEGGKTTTDYAIRHAYVLFMSAKGLEWHSDMVGDVEVRTYFYPDMRPQGRVVHDVSVRVIRDMPAYTGPYPYDHIYTLPSPIVANAFSVPGLTFMGLNFYRFEVPNAPYQFGRFTPYVGGKDGFEMVVVHEHVHNWWGHNIGGNNSNPDAGPLDNWLTEGITTYYSEMVWFDTQYGPNDAAASSDGKVLDQIVFRKLFRAGSGPAALEERGAAEPGGDAYEKTALALRALEAYAIATGRPNATFDALKAIQRERGVMTGGASAVNTREAFAIFERVFDENLSWHFEPWFLGGDLPDFSVKSVKVDGANLTVEVANGAVQGGVLVRATTLTGRTLQAWGVAPADGTALVNLTIPTQAGMDPIVRVELDPLQHVYESSEGNNVWIGRA